MRDYRQFYINGQWVDPAAAHDFDVINPATEDVCARISLGSEADVNKAVAAAKTAFESFSRTSRQERIELLEACVAAYKKHYMEIADAIREEMGAPQSLANTAQAYCGQAHLEEALKVLRTFEFEEDLGEHRLFKEPIGVCGLITPWNWPVNQISCKVAPALAVGCTMVLKPSEVAPLSGYIFAQVMHEAGVPAGVFNMVNGDGPGVGTALSKHPDVSMMSFTGSTRAGSLVAQNAAPTVKRVTQELGGKSPNIVLDDANLEAAVARGVRHMYNNTGQSCNAPSRMLVPAAKLAAAEAIAAKVTQAVVVGDPTAEKTTMGPVVSEVQFNKIQALIQKGIDEGAKLVTGGTGRPEGLNKGYFVRPTVFSQANNDMTIAREEIFGPVLTMIPYDTEEEAIRIANDTPYGLAGYVQSGDLDHARKVAARIRAGNVSINGSAAGFDVPFGGYKQSGNGREWGSHGFTDFLEIKAVQGFGKVNMGQFVLAIDQGTTGSTVALMDARGKLRSSVNVEFRQIYPQPGWVEHRPADIWASVRKGLHALLRKNICKPREIVAIGITNQRETALLWDTETGEPFYNAIVWQCRRTTDFCESLRAAGHEKTVRRKSGLVLDPYFSGSKYRWLLTHAPGIARGLKSKRVAAGTIDSFLIWQLTGGEVHVTDVSNASRTSLMNLKTGRWDQQLLELFEVPREILPTIVPSSAILGHTRGVPGLPDGIPISGVAGDQQAALFGQACFDVGDAKCTFGTGSFILMNTGAERLQSHAGLLTTVAWQLGEKANRVYALEGGAFVCGAAVQWLRDGLKMIRTAPDIEKLALQVADHGGVEFVPALTGLGAPHWAPDARGTLTGITRGTERGHVARATLDAMALQNADILRAMESDLGKRMRPLRVDGGAAANNLLMQIQADVLGRRLIRPQVIETTVAGACYLAGLGVGLWQSQAEVKDIWRAEREFSVQMSASARRRRMSSWNTAVQRTLL